MLPICRCFKRRVTPRKLRIGSHRGNSFVIVLRQLSSELSQLDDRLANVARLGFPNYFGMQRFGRELSNLKAVRSFGRFVRTETRETAAAQTAKHGAVGGTFTDIQQTAFRACSRRLLERAH